MENSRDYSINEHKYLRIYEIMLSMQRSLLTNRNKMLVIMS